VPEAALPVPVDRPQPDQPGGVLAAVLLGARTARRWQALQ
jgi:hypothetical protein